MNFIQPNVEWWPQKTIIQQIARVGRLCKKTKGRQPSEDLSEEQRERFIEERDHKTATGFWKSGHCSMYRHGTAYYFIKHDGKLPRWIWPLISASPYIECVVQGHRVWISTNMQYLCEHQNVMEVLDNYGIDEQEFIERAQKYQCHGAFMLLRMTMVVTTQISTTRELNRTSPNSISEQSTRYVDFGRKGGVGIAVPHWWQNSVSALRNNRKGNPLRFRRARAWVARIAYYCGCKVCEWMYYLMLRAGMKPQDARGVLPLDTFSVVAYTYSLNEWKRIIDLRYRGTTGAPHPNARISGGLIADIINKRMREYLPNFEI